MTAPLTGSWAGQSPTATNLDGTTHGSGTTSERNAGTGADFADRPFFDTDLKAWYHYDTEWKKHAAIVDGALWPASFSLNDKLFIEPTNRYYQVIDTDPIICKSSDTDQYIGYQDDAFTGYADTTAGDLAYPTNSTSRLRVNPTTDVLDVDAPLAIASPSRLYRDMLLPYSDKYMARFKMDVKTVTQGATGHSALVFIGFSAETADVDSSNSFVGLAAKLTSSINEYRALDDEASAIAFGGQVFAHAVAVEVLYVEIIVDHIAETYDINLYSDSGYSTLVEGETGQVLSSTHPKARYFIIHVDGTNASGDHQLTLEIDDLIIADGVNSIS